MNYYHVYHDAQVSNFNFMVAWIVINPSNLQFKEEFRFSKKSWKCQSTPVLYQKQAHSHSRVKKRRISISTAVLLFKTRILPLWNRPRAVNEVLFTLNPIICQNLVPKGVPRAYLDHQFQEKHTLDLSHVHHLEEKILVTKGLATHWSKHPFHVTPPPLLPSVKFSSNQTPFTEPYHHIPIRG